MRVTNAELDPNAPSTPAELVEIESKHVSVKMPMTKLHKTPSLTYINRVREALS